MFSYCFMCNSNGDRMACVAEGGQACHTNYKAASVRQQGCTFSVGCCAACCVGMRIWARGTATLLLQLPSTLVTDASGCNPIATQLDAMGDQMKSSRHPVHCRAPAPTSCLFALRPLKVVPAHLTAPAASSP